MKEIIQYVCEVCGLEYSKKEDCIECEKRHDDLTPVRIAEVKRQFSDFSVRSIPHVIIVEMKNGERWEYVVSRHN